VGIKGKPWSQKRIVQLDLLAGSNDVENGTMPEPPGGGRTEMAEMNDGIDKGNSVPARRGKRGKSQTVKELWAQVKAGGEAREEAREEARSRARGEATGMTTPAALPEDRFAVEIKSAHDVKSEMPAVEPKSDRADGEKMERRQREQEMGWDGTPRSMAEITADGGAVPEPVAAPPLQVPPAVVVPRQIEPPPEPESFTRPRSYPGKPVQPFSTMAAEDWDRQFIRQMEWTEGLRNHLYRRAGLPARKHILEVGCGTGRVAEEVAGRARASVYGLDLREDFLALARARCPKVRWVEGNALDLPFSDSSFDLVLCHFFLLWAAEPERAVAEMARITRSGGMVAVLAEPDYGGRIDYPDNCSAAGELHIRSIRREGGDPCIGRRVDDLLRAAGLLTQRGVSASMWEHEKLAVELDSEWVFARQVWEGLASEKELADLAAADREAVERRRRLVYMPLFYGLGRRA